MAEVELQGVSVVDAAQVAAAVKFREDPSLKVPMAGVSLALWDAFVSYHSERGPYTFERTVWVDNIRARCPISTPVPSAAASCV